ncbi:MAG: hypothetical protein RR788_04095 [Erysipelotrichaceae bacterium]
MIFYYEATATSFYDGEEKFLCSCNQLLEKKDYVVVEIENEFMVARIKNKVDELEAMLSGANSKEVIQKIEMKEYFVKKENKVKRLLLLSEMEEKCKEVKMLETLKKYSDRDEDMKAMYEQFENLAKR